MFSKQHSVTFISGWRFLILLLLQGFINRNKHIRNVNYEKCWNLLVLTGVTELYTEKMEICFPKIITCRIGKTWHARPFRILKLLIRLKNFFMLFNHLKFLFWQIVFGLCGLIKLHVNTSIERSARVREYLYFLSSLFMWLNVYKSWIYKQNQIVGV